MDTSVRSRFTKPRNVGGFGNYANAYHAHVEWHDRWKKEAASQGWSLFHNGSCYQIQKLDDPADWETVDGSPAPQWDNDAIAWGMVYHGTDPMHVATREFLKQHAPVEWALIEEACNGTSDTEGALHPGTGAADGG